MVPLSDDDALKRIRFDLFIWRRTTDLASVPIEACPFATTLVAGHLRYLCTAAVLAGAGEADVTGSTLKEGGKGKIIQLTIIYSLELLIY